MPEEISKRIVHEQRPPVLRPFFAWAMLLLLLFWGANTWLTRWQGGDADPEEAQRAELRIKTLAELRADNAKKLESYAWVDRSKGSVQIPIADAMKLVLADINTQRRAAFPVATPVPTATPATPAPATP